jgi:lysophospholipase L1-like esterase
MRTRVLGIGLIMALASAGCGAGTDRGTAGRASADGEEERVRFVALGDSYTIGTSVSEAERWPNQLVARIESLVLAGNPAVNGFTSADVIGEELPQLDRLRPELVSLLIGVNDVVQGVTDAEYAGNVAVILEELLTRLPPERILCVATPDYTRTPRGADYGDPAMQSDRIVRVNAILREACEGRGAAFVPDIFEISQAATDDPTLVADDGLHPSGAQYARWVDAIEPIARRLLDDG